MSEAAKKAPLIITMWETYGSGMEEVAAQVAERLGVQLHKQAFTSDQIEAAEAARAEEGGFMRMVRRVGSMHIGDAVSSGTARAEQESWVELAAQNTKIVRDQAKAGGVILGRNGAFVLQDEPRALHIKLDGHPRARAEQAARLKGISLDEATKRLPKEDEFRRSFSLNTYNFDPAGNEYYTLVVTSPKLGVEETVRLILEAAKDL